MKFLIAFLLCLLSTVCQAQNTYDVTWKTIDCTYSISMPGRPDRKFYPQQVPPQSPVTLIIEIEKSDFKEIQYTGKKQDGSDTLKTMAQDKLTFTDNDTALKIEIELVGTDKSKMQIKGLPGELVYPYYFIIKNIKGDSCELTLGDSELSDPNPNSDTNPNPDSQINILDGIIFNASKDLEALDYCGNMAHSNVLIVIDASAGPSANSRLYRKSSNKKDDCKCNLNGGVKFGDYVKIYLENFNPYRHTASVTIQEVDASFGAAWNLFQTANNVPHDTNAPVASSTNSRDANKYKILKYAEAVRQLQVYIEFMKNNSQPDSRVLAANKFTILENLSKWKLTGDDIDEIYDALEEDKKSFEEAYRMARLFNQIKNELLTMTYTLEASFLLPDNILSFDKFEFTVTVKENNTGKDSFSKTYEYLIQGGLKVDQSFGVVFHGIRDQEFGLRSFTGRDTTFVRILNPDDGTSRDSITGIVDAPKREIIEENSSDKITFGASTLTHLYWRTSIGNRIRVGIGPEIGISADIYPVTNIRYLFGFGVLFYDGRHRFSFDLGYALGKYKAFGNGHEFGTILPGADAQPTLVDRTARSFYFGISFNTPLVRNDTQ